MNQDDVWPEFWPNKSRMTQKEFLSIIYRIDQVPHIVNYDDKDRMKELYDLRFQDIEDWCEEMLDLEGVPKGAFRTAFLREMFGETTEPQRLYEYIQSKCAPDPPEDEEEAETPEDEEADDEDGSAS